MYTNIAEINLISDEITIYYTNYTYELLVHYRKDHYRDAVFIRHYFLKYEIIIIIPINNDIISKLSNVQSRKVNLKDDIFLAKKIVHAMVFIKILNNNRTISKFNPIKLFSNQSSHNLINSYLKEEHCDIIGYTRCYELETRFYNSSPSLLGIIIKPTYQWSINVDCKTLLKYKINIDGLYVCSKFSNDNKLLGDYRKLAGTIISHNSTTALINGKNGEIELNLSKLYLENNRVNRKKIITTLDSNYDFENIENSLYTESSKVGCRLRMVDDFYRWISSQQFDNELGLRFEFKSLYNQDSDAWLDFNTILPKYIYNIYESKTSDNADRGLINYGSYDSDIFTPKTPSIAVIFKKEYRGEFTQFIKKFSDGVPNVKVIYGQPYGQGFIKKFSLHEVNWLTYEVLGDSHEDYLVAISKALNENKEINLAIILTEENHKMLDNSIDPYYVSKAKFMNSNIPVQEITLETIRKPNTYLVYSLNSIALACYAKLGGTPWVIPSNKSIDRELVIGIGSSIIKKDRFSTNDRVVGMTSVFKSDGTYCLSNTSREVPFKDYLPALLSNLKETIKDVEKSDGWIKNDTVRLVFHCFKPFKYSEIESIKKLVKEFESKYNILFAFLVISSEHPFIAIDKSNPGISVYGTSENKGKYLLSKGKAIRLDNNNYLLQLTSSREIKLAKQGLAAPLLIKLHKESTFLDMTYLLQQVVYFSGMSFRSYSTASFPVTIGYSKLISSLLGRMKSVSFWDSDSMINKLKYSKWFL